MAEDLLFSDSWHLVAAQRPALRPDVPVHRQAFRGELWHVLGDPYQNRWYRVRPAAWRFLARLDGLRTVEQAWQLCLDAEPEQAPGQQEVVNLLAQLYGAGVLRSDLPPDGAAAFKRLQARRGREVRSQLLNFLFIRIPLVDPQRWLEWATPLIRVLFSRAAFVVWLALVGVGAAVVLGQMERFSDQTRNLLAPGNLGWLYLAWTAMKLAHELAHAAAVRRAGGEVHVLGVMLLVFTPVPYVDASAAWSFRAKRDRILVGAAGVMSDLAFAAVAAVVWFVTGQGLVNSLAHNLIVLGSISTLLFNANPLLRFDGYYVLADALDQPNLQQRATAQLQSTVESRVFGRREARPVGRTPREAFWLGLFGAASGVYRVIVLVTIVGFVAGQWFGIGLLIGAAGAVLWGIVPLVRFCHYVLRSPALARCRPRALGWTAGTVAVLVVVGGLVPLPDHFRAPGVVRARHAANVVSETDGHVNRVLARSGDRVVAGQPLLELRNPELEFALRKADAMVTEVETRLAWARETQPAYLEPLRARLESARRQRDELAARRQAWVIRAPHAGVWVAPYSADYAGVWVPRGVELGTIVDPAAFYFSSVVPQTAAADLFGAPLRRGEVWLPGAAASPLRGNAVDVVPAERTRLPTASLGWLAGGEVQVSDEGSGRQTREPFFEVRIALPPDAALQHLRAGTARFTRPPRPLLAQGWRALRQLLQERYQL